MCKSVATELMVTNILAYPAYFDYRSCSSHRTGPRVVLPSRYLDIGEDTNA